MKAPALLGGIVALAVAAYGGAWYTYAEHYKPKAAELFTSMGENGLDTGAETASAPEVAVSGFPFEVRYSLHNASVNDSARFGDLPLEKAEFSEISIGYDILKDQMFMDAPGTMTLHTKERYSTEKHIIESTGMRCHFGANGLRSALLAKQPMQEWFENTIGTVENPIDLAAHMRNAGCVKHAGELKLDGTQLFTFAQPMNLDVAFSKDSNDQPVFNIVYNLQYADVNLGELKTHYIHSILSNMPVTAEQKEALITSVSDDVMKLMIAPSGSIAIDSVVTLKPNMTEGVKPEDAYNNPTGFIATLNKGAFTTEYGTSNTTGTIDFSAASTDTPGKLVLDLKNNANWGADYAELAQKAYDQVEGWSLPTELQQVKPAAKMYFATYRYLYQTPGSLQFDVKTDMDMPSVYAQSKKVSGSVNIASDAGIGLNIDVNIEEEDINKNGTINIACLDCNGLTRWTLGLGDVMYKEASNIMPIPFPVVINDKTTAVFQDMVNELTQPVEAADNKRAVTIVMEGQTTTINGQSPMEYQQKLAPYMGKYMQAVQESAQDAAQ